MSTTTTKIEWTERTWNPLRGCSRVSAGCLHCYAQSVAYRFSGPGQPYEGLARKVNGEANWTGKIQLVEDALLQPLRWKKPRRIFVNSMSDLFHDGVPDEFIDRLFHVMQQAGQHTFQILTKRPERMAAYLNETVTFHGRQWPAAQWRLILAANLRDRTSRQIQNEPWPLKNVWIGVSVEDQPTADERIPLLLQTPAAIRFVSAEPLLGPVDVRAYVAQPVPFDPYNEQRLDLVIVGGESGPKARPCHVQWIRDIAGQCRAAGTPVFIKQLGSHPTVGDGEYCSSAFEGGFGEYCDDSGRVKLHDRKGGDMAEWPADLRVRQFPGGAA